MSALPEREGPTKYNDGVKCYKWLCFRQAVYKKYIVTLPIIGKYVPVCEKHSKSTL